LGIEELKIIRSKIKERIHSWSAGLTSLSELTIEEKKRRLGLNISEEEKKIMAKKIANEDALAAHNGIVFAYPSEWDWRSVSKNNWTTSIRDQDGCGACVAFAAVATIESNLKISRKDP
jgi:C1A family cysteine protease